MDQDKFLKLQYQMKQNNEDYKDFMDGLESWSTDMKEKKDKKVEIEKNNNFPIRNSVIKVRKNTKNVKSKISAYDYEAWDKYDVDKALNNEDDENNEEVSQENTEIISKEHREVGNLRFKEGNFSEATAEYSKAIIYDANNAVLYTNRAMSLIKLGSFEAAEVDCCKAIELDHTSVKAFYRRSKCRFMLQRKEEALDDLKIVLRLDPLNKTAKNEVKELEKELNIRGIVEPIYGAPKKGKESSKPLLSINIIDINPDKSISDVVKSQSLLNNAAKDNKLAKVEENREYSTIDADLKMPTFTEPRSSVQLIKDLNKYRRNELHRAEYISNIDHNHYRMLIGHSLDCKLIKDFIDGLSFSLKASIISVVDFVIKINQLTEVARFSSLWLMMSEEERRDFNFAVASLDEKSKSLIKIII